VLKKLSLVGKDLDEYSLETVKMFRDDAVAAGFALDAEPAQIEVTVFAKQPARRATSPATVK
jgi:hypothetical protein